MLQPFIRYLYKNNKTSNVNFTNAIKFQFNESRLFKYHPAQCQLNKKMKNYEGDKNNRCSLRRLRHLVM